MNPEPVVVLSPATSKARRRLVPFLFLLYIVAYLDRINVGFASLQMNRALGFSSTAYGFGAGVFFIGYVLFEVPSNIILARVGARRWIARIMITWGVVSSATMFVRSVEAFYVVRFLLGLAEAGFFPGIVFYLTHWFPQRERARTMAAFMTAVPMAGVIGGPVSGALLTLNGFGGLAGWQWLFLLEGVPAVVLGFVVLRALPDRPRDARWLTTGERAALDAVLAAEVVGREHATAAAFRDGRTWLLAATYFTIPVTIYGIGFWLPQVLRTSRPQASDFSIGLTSTVPYAVATVAMVIIGRHSDRTGERRFHVLVPAVASAAGLALTPVFPGVVWTTAMLSVALAGVISMLGPFWALSTASLAGSGAAASIALVNSMGNTGGFVGPYMIGAVNDATHSPAAGVLAIAVILALGASVVLLVDEA